MEIREGMYFVLKTNKDFSMVGIRGGKAKVIEIIPNEDIGEDVKEHYRRQVEPELQEEVMKGDFIRYNYDKEHNESIDMLPMVVFRKHLRY